MPTSLRLSLGTARVLPDLRPVLTPAEVSGLRFHVKADAISGVANNGLLAAWSDESGNNFNATQVVDGQKPTYLTNVLNGLPVVFASNTIRYMGTTFTDALGNFTLIVVSKNHASSFAYGRVVEKAYDTGITWAQNNLDYDSAGGAVRDVGSPYGFYTPSPRNKFYIGISRRLETVHTISVGGRTSMKTRTVATTLTGTTSLGLFNIPLLNGGAVSSLAEVCLYNVGLSDNELDKICNGLAAKYQLGWDKLS